MGLAYAAEELKSISRRFSKAETTLLTGVELGPQGFETSSFSEAELIHLATHAELDRRHPELSRILLSPDSTGENYLTPLQLRGRDFNARLVVLSACEIVGQESFEFEVAL